MVLTEKKPDTQQEYRDISEQGIEPGLLILKAIAIPNVPPPQPLESGLIE